ncbi:hypothetical protein [Parachlamydia acanthamoebae]|uniref:Uncharacterized protein n=1 Tax=Parachlamydia acanthamoebae TaxID=83552 RepID=A0A0C1E734_9BACT|nr:hypothetical protein [Parachlamydia acanthamoebae]KIA77052.1 hypothetical protein DB43_GV00020 [Parachlamydia acanthamoebae]
MTKKIDRLSLTPFSQTTFDVALISSAGGAGHKIAALAIKSAHPGDCYEINTFGTLGKIGKACTNSWDKAQKQGNVKKQIKLAKRQGFAEALFSVPIYFRICYVLLRYDIDKIIDTQAIGTLPIVRAARTVNFIYRLFRKKKVITVWKIFIELPNAKSLYYHRYIKKLSKKDKKIFKFVSISPSLKTSEEEENFWKKFCNLSLMKGEIVYADSPIRKEFLAYKDCPPKPNEVAIAINTEEELTILRSLHDELGPCIDPDSPQKLLHIPVKSDDIVMTLMLGSQVAEKATSNYVSSVLKLEEIAKTKIKNLLFRFLQ